MPETTEQDLVSQLNELAAPEFQPQPETQDVQETDAPQQAVLSDAAPTSPPDSAFVGDDSGVETAAPQVAMGESVPGVSLGVPSDDSGDVSAKVAEVSAAASATSVVPGVLTPPDGPTHDEKGQPLHETNAFLQAAAAAQTLAGLPGTTQIQSTTHPLANVGAAVLDQAEYLVPQRAQAMTARIRGTSDDQGHSEALAQLVDWFHTLPDAIKSSLDVVLHIHF